MAGNNLTRTNSRPLRLTNRHHRLVELAVLGATNNEIAKALKLSAARVSQLMHHPEIMAMVATTRLQYRERSLGALHDDLEHDARNTFNKLKEHRDHDDPDVSLKACSQLWDRQIPKRTISDETHTTRFIIERRDIAYLEQVAAEDDEPSDDDTDITDVEALPIDGAPTTD